MDLRDQQALHNGFGDGLARAFELAVTPVVFAAMGYALDRWLGTSPFFTLLLLAFAFCGTFVMMWVRYDAEMKRHEDEAVWSRNRRGVAR